MVQEAWILSLLCPNADEQAANRILSPEFRGNTESKIKANSSSLYLLHSILPWFALSVTVLSWLKPQQDSQPCLSPSSCKFFRSNLLNQYRQKTPKTSVTRDTLNELINSVRKFWIQVYCEQDTSASLLIESQKGHTKAQTQKALAHYSCVSLALGFQTKPFIPKESQVHRA